MFRGSSAVEQLTVNQLVVGSNPTPGAMWEKQGEEPCFFLYIGDES